MAYNSDYTMAMAYNSDYDYDDYELIEYPPLHHKGNVKKWKRDLQKLDDRIGRVLKEVEEVKMLITEKEENNEKMEEKEYEEQEEEQEGKQEKKQEEKQEKQEEKNTQNSLGHKIFEGCKLILFDIVVPLSIVSVTIYVSHFFWENYR